MPSFFLQKIVVSIVQTSRFNLVKITKKFFLYIYLTFENTMIYYTQGFLASLAFTRKYFLHVLASDRS